MQAVIIFFTLCGIPQYAVVGDSSGYVHGTPQKVAKVLKKDLLIQILESPIYIKQERKLEVITGVTCA